MKDAPKFVDRLQPALLDRLTDDDPTNRVEAAEQRVMSRTRLRAAVLRDLSWLFNATAPSESAGLAAYPHVRGSVLGFGLPPLSGMATSSIDAATLEAKVRRAIIDHEPRILPATLRVEALVSEAQLDHHNQISFRIAGQLWAQPVPMELLLHTAIDLETGRVEIKELPR
ncbi:type VI secretion system baseplate subunit TssE [soil metagenome]